MCGEDGPTIGRGYENETNSLCCQVECGLGRGVQPWEGKREEQISIMHKRQTALQGRTNSGSHFWRRRNHLESWVDLRWPRISWGHFKALNKDKTFTLTHTHLYTCMYTCMPSSDGRKPWSACSILQPGEWQTQMVMCGELRETRAISLPASALQCHQLCASLCRTAGVHGRIRSRQLASALVRREIMSVQGLETRF